MADKIVRDVYSTVPGIWPDFEFTPIRGKVNLECTINNKTQIGEPDVAQDVYLGATEDRVVIDEYNN